MSLLTEFAPGLWVHDGVIRFFGFRLQRCMTVVRLRNDLLLVHSPNTLDGALRTELDRLGDVAYVLAPNKMHGHAVDQFAAAYPSATVFGSPGLPERRPDLRFDRILGDQAEPE